ncbi:hypothetical protein [Bacillus thuringiensis]|uniref:hypothetical protein n=1 Tax=Bacillus thuringiensis TaxID=1428 RepID=UPI0021D688ED|nr:hypothetical protein [Bacillus thuringiensis]MCU7668011.1 hypothetical protein [Bacillus thuringiensis]
MLGDIFKEMVRGVQEELAKEQGISIEEYLSNVAEKEKRRKEEEERYLASDEYKQEVERQKAEAVRKKLETLFDMFAQPIDETLNSNKTNLRKIIRWTPSRFNEWRKEDVVELALREIQQGEDGFSEYSCGAYSDDTRIRKYRNYGFSQHLAILDGKIRWIDGYNCEWQRVYELKVKK